MKMEIWAYTRRMKNTSFLQRTRKWKLHMKYVKKLKVLFKYL